MSRPTYIAHRNGVQRKARPVAELNFLRKAQIVAAFEPDVPPEVAITEAYDGLFAFGHPAANISEAQIKEFFRAEGITPIVTRGHSSHSIKLKAEDYYALEQRYTIPLTPDVVKGVLGKFHEDCLTATFHNHPAAFGSNCTRVAKLLRDHSMAFTLQFEGNKSIGAISGESAELHNGVITLAPESYAKLQANMPDILSCEAKRHTEHQRQAKQRFD